MTTISRPARAIPDADALAELATGLSGTVSTRPADLDTHGRDEQVVGPDLLSDALAAR